MLCSTKPHLGRQADDLIFTSAEHNGFSHQAPGFVSTVLSLPSHLARVYFPADANQSVSIMAHCLRSKNCQSRVLFAEGRACR